MADQKVMRNLLFVSAIKRAELLHELANFVVDDGSSTFKERMFDIHNQIEENMERDFKDIVEEDIEITMDMIENLNSRVVHLQERTNEQSQNL